MPFFILNFQFLLPKIGSAATMHLAYLREHIEAILLID